MKEGGVYKYISECSLHSLLAALFLLMSILFMCNSNSALAREQKPQRIVSLNVCTDQILMLLVPPERIAALSYLARNSGISVMHKEASAIPFTYGSAEHVFILKPDLVLAGTYTTRATVNLLKRLGRTLIEVAPARNFEDIETNIRMVGTAVGETKKAEVLINEMRARIQHYLPKGDEHKLDAIPFYSNGYTVGKNTLVDQLLYHSGFTSLGRKNNLPAPVKSV